MEKEKTFKEKFEEMVVDLVAKKVIDDPEKRKLLEKPCHVLNYCPYGVLVEDFPLGIGDKKQCYIFGHDCPVYHVAQMLCE